MNYTFKMDLRVLDKQALYNAAAAHPDSTEFLMDQYGEVDVEACLITLLDPTFLAGCEIQESYADFHGDLHGDEA